MAGLPNRGVVLLVETAAGDLVGVRFADRDGARAWEDHQQAKGEPITVRGVVPVVLRGDALQMTRGQ